MKLVYRGIAYESCANKMDPALITYLMKQKKEFERKQKESQRELANLINRQS